LTLEVAGGERARSPEALLDQFGLGNFLHHYPHQLSGGMQQRVNIACAMVHEPSILLLDEPFGALDELTRESMVAWLRGVLEGGGRTVMLVTHSVDEAVVLSDRVVVLASGPGRVVGEISIDRESALRSKTDLAYQAEVARVREVLV
jgi:NitT/TauT family transport system ATP-binding protein